MCIQAKHNIEFLFSDVEDPFLQDLDEFEDIQDFDEFENIYLEDYGKYCDIQHVCEYIMLVLPYIFIIQSTFIYVKVNLDTIFLILISLIYGMVITVNQLHNKHTTNYWIFVLFTLLILPIDIISIIYIVPNVIEYIFKKNYMINKLIEHYGIIIGNHIFWTFITWTIFMFMTIQNS